MPGETGATGATSTDDHPDGMVGVVGVTAMLDTDAVPRTVADRLVTTMPKYIVDGSVMVCVPTAVH